MRDFDFDNKPIVDIANEIILDAVKRGASDIHFDPFEDDLIIRIRIDGVLYDYARVPSSHKRNMISRIKMIASMNIMETRLPQDGAIKSRIGGKDVDLRVSSLPTYNGEKVVLRILDYSMSLQGLESLGFSKHNYDTIIKMTEIPNGIILVTGATGSGKSTTVYSVLQKLNTRDVNIITVEDPVEMNINGLNQVQAQEEIGLDFATVLRSILRQDPDIIMIGEIRDSETARIAVRASITGHKVLSTIHTNNALNTIERLTDMDVERYLIGTSLNGIISQKLARKLCPHCRILRETNDYEKKLFKTVLRENVDKIYDYNPEGCDKCFKGYKDRTAIAEVLLINDAIRTAITTAAPKDEMRRLVYIEGQTRTLLEDGLEKVMNGETSFQELYKLVDIENDLDLHKKYKAEFAKSKRDIQKLDNTNDSNNDNLLQEDVNNEPLSNSVINEANTTLTNEDDNNTSLEQNDNTPTLDEVPYSSNEQGATTTNEEANPTTLEVNDNTPITDETVYLNNEQGTTTTNEEVNPTTLEQNDNVPIADETAYLSNEQDTTTTNEEVNSTTLEVNDSTPSVDETLDLSGKQDNITSNVEIDTSNLEQNNNISSTDEVLDLGNEDNSNQNTSEEGNLVIDDNSNIDQISEDNTPVIPEETLQLDESNISIVPNQDSEIIEIDNDESPKDDDVQIIELNDSTNDNSQIEQVDLNNDQTNIEVLDTDNQQ